MSPHSIRYLKLRLSQGTRYDESFESEIQLKDGSIYSVSFGAQDMAGNVSNDVVVQNVTYDSSPQELTILYPKSPTFTNDLVVESFQSVKNSQRVKCLLKGQVDLMTLQVHMRLN